MFTRTDATVMLLRELDIIRTLCAPPQRRKNCSAAVAELVAPALRRRCGRGNTPSAREQRGNEERHGAQTY